MKFADILESQPFDREGLTALVMRGPRQPVVVLGELVPPQFAALLAFDAFRAAMQVSIHGDYMGEAFVAFTHIFAMPDWVRRKGKFTMVGWADSESPDPEVSEGFMAEGFWVETARVGQWALYVTGVPRRHRYAHEFVVGHLVFDEEGYRGGPVFLLECPSEGEV